jgi:thioredoxin-dependent peroxiredoxin
MHAIGDLVPSFSLSTDGGSSVSNLSLKGQRYVLYFYPKDDTPGCTKEACGFRDQLPNFDGANVRVFGVSADSEAAHGKFVKKYDLNFTLISDPARVLIEGLGVWVEKSMYGKKYMGIARATFVIDASGKVERVWDKVSVETHAAEVLAYVTGVAAAATPNVAAAKKAVTKKAVGKSAAAKTVVR